LAQLSANKGQLPQFLHAVLSDSPSSPSEVDQLGKKAGLLAGHEKLELTAESARLDEAIARDVKLAEQLQITVTPTIIFAGMGARMVVSNLDQGR
jgi:protein-disulfide isomerase